MDNVIVIAVIASLSILILFETHRIAYNIGKFTGWKEGHEDTKRATFEVIRGGSDGKS